MKGKLYKEKIEDIYYEIRRTHLAKRMSLKVSGDGRVWVSIPLSASAVQARDFIKKNLDFVKKGLRNAEIKRDSIVRNNDTDILLPIKGIWCKTEILEAEIFEIIVNIDEKFIRLTVPPQENFDLVQSKAIHFWQNAIIRQANIELPPRVVEISQELGEPLRRIAVKDQLSRWGSCASARRSVNFNWRCVLFPDDVRDYLIYHELAHLRHPNHSSAFWNQVEIWCPKYNDAEQWIRANGKQLMAITRAQ